MKNETENERSWMVAVTFAEAGEWETARAMTPLPRKSKWAAFLEQAFMAVAYAEEGMHEEAQRIVGMKQRPPKRISSFIESLGLQNARLAYGIMQEGASC
jgi:hypothetical protein